MTCYKNPNPFPTALYIIAAVMGAIFAYLIFTDSANAELGPSRMVGPGVICRSTDAPAEDFAKEVLKLKLNDNITVFEEQQPYTSGGYTFDRGIEYLVYGDDYTIHKAMVGGPNAICKATMAKILTKSQNH